MKTEQELHKILTKLLLHNGYDIQTNPSIKVSNKIIRPDFIISKDKSNCFIELKTGRFLPGAVLNQMQFYQENLNTDYGYLAIYDDGYIRGSMQELILASGFGIIKFNEKEITEKLKPYSKTELTKKVKPFDRLSEREKKDLELKEKIKSKEETNSKLDYLSEELKKFPSQLLLYVLFGGLLLFSLSKIFEIWFKEKIMPYCILSGTLVGVALIGISVWKIIKWMNDKNESGR